MSAYAISERPAGYGDCWSPVVKVPVRTPGVIDAGYDRRSRLVSGTVPKKDPVHGKGGWTLAKYEWRKDGTGRFLYVRNNGERREVIRSQTGWCV